MTRTTGLTLGIGIAVGLIALLSLLPSGVHEGAVDAVSTLPSSPLSGRNDPTTVWTGWEMIVWGGEAATAADGSPEGAAYDPRRRVWRTLPFSGLEPRRSAAGVWTGRFVVVWGGRSNTTGEDLSDGAAYDPVADRWAPIPAAPVSGRHAIWDGSGLVVWGSDGDTVRVARLEPAADAWEEWDAPIVAGHAVEGAFLRGRLVLASYPAGPGRAADVATLEPVTGNWRVFGASPVSARLAPVVVGSTNALFLAGADSGDELAANAALDPLTGRWRRLRNAEFAGFYTDRVAWTGEHALFLGRSLASYDAGSDRWRLLLLDVEEEAREQFGMVWAGDRLLVWGGSGTGDGDPPVATGLQLVPDLR